MLLLPWRGPLPKLCCICRPPGVADKLQCLVAAFFWCSKPTNVKSQIRVQLQLWKPPFRQCIHHAFQAAPEHSLPAHVLHMHCTVVLDRWGRLRAALRKHWSSTEDAADCCDAHRRLQEHQGGPRLGHSVALLHSDAERREFISAGTAAGLAVRLLCCSGNPFIP